MSSLCLIQSYNQFVSMCQWLCADKRTVRLTMQAQPDIRRSGKHLQMCEWVGSATFRRVWTVSKWPNNRPSNEPMYFFYSVPTKPDLLGWHLCLPSWLRNDAVRLRVVFFDQCIRGQWILRHVSSWQGVERNCVRVSRRTDRTERSVLISVQLEPTGRLKWQLFLLPRQRRGCRRSLRLQEWTHQRP